MGDADAALSFFGRASDVDPRNARAKAGMAAALVRLERAGDALLVVRRGDFAGRARGRDRRRSRPRLGLLGHPGRAQADYALSLRREDDPEVRRRLALSLAISGQRDEALRVIEAQLRDRRPRRLAHPGLHPGADRRPRRRRPDRAQHDAGRRRRARALPGPARRPQPVAKGAGRPFRPFPERRQLRLLRAGRHRPDPGALAMAQGSAPMGAARDRRQTDAPGLRVDPTAPRRRPGEQSVASQIRPAPSNRADARPRRRRSQVAERRSPVAAPPRQGPSAGQAPPWPTPVLDDGQARRTQPQPQPRYQPQPQTRAPAQPRAEPVLDESSSPGFTLVPQGRPLGRRPSPWRPPRRTVRAGRRFQHRRGFRRFADGRGGGHARAAGDGASGGARAPPVRGAAARAASPRRRGPAPPRHARRPAATRNSRARSPAAPSEPGLGADRDRQQPSGPDLHVRPVPSPGAGPAQRPRRSPRRERDTGCSSGPSPTEAAARTFARQLDRARRPGA